jgi:hypothetical protein|eukprot:COSAG01_NODE_7271_length_3274_cov_6.594016_3_plen_67_part_00
MGKEGAARAQYAMPRIDFSLKYLFGAVGTDPPLNEGYAMRDAKNPAIVEAFSKFTAGSHAVEVCKK